MAAEGSGPGWRHRFLPAGGPGSTGGPGEPLWAAEVTAESSVTASGPRDRATSAPASPHCAVSTAMLVPGKPHCRAE